MKVNELIQHLEKCNPLAEVRVGNPYSCPAESVDSVTEIGYSTNSHPTVHIYSSGRSEY